MENSFNSLTLTLIFMFSTIHHNPYTSHCLWHLIAYRIVTRIYNIVRFQCFDLAHKFFMRNHRPVLDSRIPKGHSMNYEKHSYLPFCAENLDFYVRTFFRLPVGRFTQQIWNSLCGLNVTTRHSSSLLLQHARTGDQRSVFCDS